MGARSVQRRSRELWRLIDRQHGVVTYAQLIEAGLTRKGIRHRLRSGRLHLLMPGVYAVGRPNIDRKGWWMAATLRAGEGSALSHESMAEAWGLKDFAAHPIDVSVPARRNPREPRLRIHRRSVFPRSELTWRFNIPATSPVLTLVDLAPRLTTRQLERAVERGVGTELITPASLRIRMDALPRLPGLKILTESELERLFVPIALSAGLPPPQTQVHLNGHRVDFFWPELGLVVEADSLRWHRTAAAQSRDLRRDQDHARAGLSVLRFTHFQIRYEPGRVRETLADVAARLA
jgi:hypothetical protein